MVELPARMQFLREFQCSSASRKFLNPARRSLGLAPSLAFQCSSASRKFLNRGHFALVRPDRCGFQCSSASRKFLNDTPFPTCTRTISVSVLFSEPKIPQSVIGNPGTVRMMGFSALQRAENSSIRSCCGRRTCRRMFQCSSASRKFLNRRAACRSQASTRRFSALQRAENSSMRFFDANITADTDSFSALQRAENSSMEELRFEIDRARAGFSALQRAENSSI